MVEYVWQILNLFDAACMQKCSSQEAQWHSTSGGALTRLSETALDEVLLLSWGRGGREGRGVWRGGVLSLHTLGVIV